MATYIRRRPLASSSAPSAPSPPSSSSSSSTPAGSSASSAPIPTVSWHDLARATGRPRGTAPRLVQVPGLPPGVSAIPIGTRVLPVDAPRPRCVWPGCENQALLAGAQPADATLTRRWRAWCYRHRPAAVLRDGLDPPMRQRPRTPPTDPALRCAVPGCPHRREIKDRRADGTWRRKRFCRWHYDHPDTVPVALRWGAGPGASDPDAAPGPRAPRTADGVPRMRVPAAAPASSPPSPPAPGGGRTVTFREDGRSFTVHVPPGDLRVLRRLATADTTPYRAATDGTLTRAYPTAAIAALFAQWRTE